MIHEDIENFRRFWYPRLHRFLGTLPGDLGAEGYCYENQYTYTMNMPEAEAEGVLMSLGFRPNPMAYYKYTEDGRGSIGSWILTQDRCRPVMDPWAGLGEGYPFDTRERQIHVTVFPSRDGSTQQVELYAHEEYWWLARPFAHLREEHFSPRRGKAMLRWLLDHEDSLEGGVDFYV